MNPSVPTRLLIVSPHLDDAVLSVGATISALTRQRSSVVVCTIFAGEPVGPFSQIADGFHEDCGLTGNPIKPRKLEDFAALSILGADAVHLSFLDAVYRKHGGDWLCTEPRSMFQPDPPDEPALVAAVISEIENLIEEHTPDAVWTCRGIGSHIDHLITRRAVIDARKPTNVDVGLWEDLPYGFTELPRLAEPVAARIDVQPSDIEAKIAAIGAYRSQTRMLWPDNPKWMEEFRSHGTTRQRTFGAHELLWTDLLSELTR